MSVRRKVSNISFCISTIEIYEWILMKFYLGRPHTKFIKNGFGNCGYSFTGSSTENLFIVVV
jgi:hypothetical protein